MKTTLTLAIFFISFTASSQRLMTSVISSFGGSTNNSGLYLSQTAGQQGRIDATNSGSLNLQQGFEKHFFLNIGLGYQSQKIELSLYPNPNQGNFFLSSNQRDLNAYTVAVYNTFGKLIFETQLSYLNSSEISLPFIASGTYLVRVSTPDGSLGNSKFVKY